MRAVVFDHDHDRTLVDGQEGGGEPAHVEVEGIGEALVSPNFIAQFVIEKAGGFHGFGGGVGHGTECRCGRYYSEIVVGRMRAITGVVVGSGESPAFIGIAVMLSRIGFAVGVVDFAVVGGLCFVVGIGVAESARV